MIMPLRVFRQRGLILRRPNDFCDVKFVRKIIRIIFSLPLFLTAAHAVASLSGSQAVVNPSTYRSPSGKFVLKMEPSDLYGRGEADYRLTSGGSVVWEGKKPFTLREVGVADDGSVAGYAYTHGEEGFSEKARRDMGQFIVAIIGPTGAVRLKETVHREMSRFPDDLPNPLARGVLMDQANNLFVVRLRDADLNRGRESWWMYELASGKALGRRALTAEDTDTASPIRAVPVNGTPLILVEYWRWQPPDMNARFALLDHSLKEVWSTTWRRDYNIDGGEEAQDQLRDRILAEGAIMDTSGSNQFELFSANTSERVTFVVRGGPAIGNKWVVSEVSREKQQIAKVATEAPLPFRTNALKLLGTFTLENDQTARNDVFRDVTGFGFDDRDRIGLLRNGKDGNYNFALIENDGRLVREFALPRPGFGKSAVAVHCTWVAGDRWIVTWAPKEKRSLGG